MWQRAIIEELSSIFARVLGSVKSWIIHFLSSWVVNRVGTMADWVSCNLALAAAPFCNLRNISTLLNININLISEGQHLLNYFYWKTPPGLLIQHLHRSLTSPLPATLFHKHWPAQKRRGKTYVWHYKLWEGMFPPIFLQWCEWKNKTWFTLTNQSGPALLCQRFLMMSHSTISFFHSTVCGKIAGRNAH